jgi:hypothetical protein
MSASAESCRLTITMARMADSRATLALGPGTGCVLADKELVDIYAFLQTLPGRRPAKDIAILSD